MGSAAGASRACMRHAKHAAHVMRRMRAHAGDLPRGSAHRAQANLYDSCRLPRLEVIDVLHASNSGGRCRRGGQPTAARNAAKYTPGTCATLEIFTSAISRSCRRGLRQRAAGCARWRVYAEPCVEGASTVRERVVCALPEACGGQGSRAIARLCSRDNGAATTDCRGFTVGAAACAGPPAHGRNRRLTS